MTSLNNSETLLAMAEGLEGCNNDETEIQIKQQASTRHSDNLEAEQNELRFENGVFTDTYDCADELADRGTGTSQTESTANHTYKTKRKSRRKKTDRKSSKSNSQEAILSSCQSKIPVQNGAIRTEHFNHIDDIFLANKNVNDFPHSAKSGENVESETQRPQRKKKRKHLKNLKKASSKVGIISPEVPESDVTEGGAKEHQSPNDTTQPLSALSLPSDGDTKTKQETVHPKPMLICRIIATYPFLSFFSISFIHLATFGTSIGLALTGHDVFPLVFDTLPLYTYNDARLKELAWKSRNNYDGWVYRPFYGNGFQSGYRSRVKDTVEVIFEKPGVNILTQEYFKWIEKAEERLFNVNGYQRYFCYLKTYYSCLKPQSLLRFFDGTYANIDPVFTDTSYSNITHVLYTATQYNETKEFLELFLGKDSVVTPGYVSTSITRSFFIMGWPLGRMANYMYGTLNDLEAFLIDVFKPEIENIRDIYLVERLDTLYLSKIMYEYDLSRQALKDLMLAVGSVLFIFLFMVVQTGSIVVTFLGITSILSSFFLTNLIYRYIFQYIYFGFFHVISIFLILGIGADDLFVFYDTWRLTGQNIYPSDAHRLSDCYRKAAKTTFVTSCTTMMAFFVSGFSPLLPVKTFGIFSGLLVLFNYVWVIVYFPAIIMLHHLKTKPMWYKFKGIISSCFRSKEGCRKRRLSQSSISTISENLSESGNSKEGLSSPRHTEDEKVNTNADQKTYLNIMDKIDDKNLEKFISIRIKDNNSPHCSVGSTEPLDLKALEEQTKMDEYQQQQLNKPKKTFDQRNRVIRFLKNAFFDFMTLRIMKFLVPTILIMVSIFFILSAKDLEPDTHQLRLWRSTHNYAKATNRHYFSFLRNLDDEYQRLYLVWGLKQSDVSSCNMKSADFCFGTNLRDEAFDMNSPAAQLAFKSLCERLDNIDEETANKLRIRPNVYTGKYQIACFTQEFDAFFEKEANQTTSGGRKYPVGTKLTLPVNSSHVVDFMSARSNSYIYTSNLPTDFNNYFEILVDFWMTNGYSVRATDDYFLFNSLLTEQTTPKSQHAFYYESGLYYGTRMRYLAIEVNTTMNVYSLGYQDGLPVYHAWEEYIAAINAEMPSPVNNGFQVTENLWHWIHVQEILATSAITGILVGLCSAWPILILTTLNYIIGTLAVITIGLVTACVVGMIPLVGWKLGVLESINLCMVVGLSVDYIVHLAEAYRASESPRRMEKVRDMLESIGLSVLSGAFTTIGAAVFMLFAQIQFFFQFGIFIISTVGIALVFSLFGFTTIMSICGPQGKTGSLVPLFTALCARVERKKKGDSEEEVIRCVGPSVVSDRIYNWLSYRGENKKKETK